jgi:hypothetical protein
MSVEFVLLGMEDHIKEHMDLDPTEHGWSSQDFGRTYFDDNGHEVYIFDWGFLITRHDDGDRARLLRSDRKGIPAGSPLAVAYLEEVMKDVEEFAEHYDDV